MPRLDTDVRGRVYLLGRPPISSPLRRRVFNDLIAMSPAAKISRTLVSRKKEGYNGWDNRTVGASFGPAFSVED
jgi:hypothetical protein